MAELLFRLHHLLIIQVKLPFSKSSHRALFFFFFIIIFASCVCFFFFSLQVVDTFPAFSLVTVLLFVCWYWYCCFYFLSTVLTSAYAPFFFFQFHENSCYYSFSLFTIFVIFFFCCPLQNKTISKTNEEIERVRDWLSVANKDLFNYNYWYLSLSACLVASLFYCQRPFFFSSSFFFFVCVCSSPVLVRLFCLFDCLIFFASCSFLSFVFFFYFCVCVCVCVCFFFFF